jgi:hypothetical protein
LVNRGVGGIPTPASAINHDLTFDLFLKPRGNFWGQAFYAKAGIGRYFGHETRGFKSTEIMIVLI